MKTQERTLKLRSISPDQAQQEHEWLRQCFREELVERLKGEDYEEFENIYHCALLLHIIGDESDLPLMYSAKCSGDMDLGSGFDWQFLFMKDPKTLENYALSINRPDLAAWLVEYASEYEEEDMESWLEGVKNYYR
jgi:hypothetical protein